MRRDYKVSVMLTESEVSWLREVIGTRILDGERMTMSKLVGALAFHPNNPMLNDLSKEISKSW